MANFYMGVYWPADRPLTLRQYADLTHNFLLLLQREHAVFRMLQWVGDRPNSAKSLLPDLSNLDELIYHNARCDAKYRDANPDGTPSWASIGLFGYGMVYGTGKSARSGGVTIRIDAGAYDIRTPNAVWIGFPLPECPGFPHREFYDHAFLERLFRKMIDFWNPASGLVTSHLFSEAVVDEGLPYVGWLTYLRDPRAAALRNDELLRDLDFKSTPDGGTLISLDSAIVRPDNMTQVDRARRLRSIVVAEKLVFNA